MNDGVVKRTEIEGKDNSSSDKSNYKTVKKGDMVYNSMRMWQGANGISEYDGIVSPAYTIMYPKINLDSQYIAAFFKTTRLIKQFQKNSQGMTSDTWNLKYPQIAPIRIFLPQFEEQQKIGTFIKLIDSLIKKQQELVDNLKLYKRGLVFSLFRDDNKFNMECTYTPLNELLSEFRVRETAGLRVCSVAVNKGIVDQLEHLGRSFSASDTSKYGKVTQGDIVYTKSPTGDFPYGIVKQNKMNETVAVSPLYGVYTPIYFEVGNLLHHYFSQKENANNYIAPLAQKGAKNTINITNARFLEGSICFPCKKSDIVAISNFFDEIERKITTEETLLEFLITYKKGLLSKLFV